jgi:hypothetical protein
MSWFTKKWDGTGDAPLRWRKPQVVRTFSVNRIGSAELAVAAICPRHTFVFPLNEDVAFDDVSRDDVIDAATNRFSDEAGCWVANFINGVSHPKEAAPEMPRWPLHNVIPAALVADQAEADVRIPLLLHIPARHRIVLAEGLRGPVRLPTYVVGNIGSSAPIKIGYPHHMYGTGVGGVSGLVVSGGTEPMHPVWVRSLRDQCASAGVAFRFEGWGDWKQCDSPGDWYGTDPSEYVIKCMWTCGSTFGPVEGEPFSPNAAAMSFARVGHSASGRLLDGVQHDALPWDKEGGR